MQIIREYQVNNGGNYRCAIRTRTYCKTFGHIANLVARAKNDYPYLKDEDIEIVIYGGDRFKGTLGVEFNIHEQPHLLYNEVDYLEYTIT